MKKAEVERLEKIMGQFEGLHREMSSLAKKSLNDSLNEFKLKFVNASLAEANTLLGKKYKPLKDFEHFDIDDLPTNSDVTFVLTAYLEELERMRADNIELHNKQVWRYKLSDSHDIIKTGAPKKISGRK